jgi:hypothetical protein
LEGKWLGTIVNQPLPALTLKELVFLSHEYYSIFLAGAATGS